MDIADRAQELEERERAASVQRQAHSEEYSPLHNDAGRRLCVDCHERIDRQRLTAAPHAVRCCECQGLHERYLKTHLASRPVC